ncbi:hypothetical protein C4552_02000, partial [Candidatus Parcubacteria bacterium]
GGAGGAIVSGDAEAAAVVLNKVNTNKTKISGACDCEDTDDITLKVKNRNWAKVKNYVEVEAKTGYNDADGGDAEGGAGNGGGVSNSDDDNQGGNGGDAGNGGEGGAIASGNTVSVADITNRVNTNITRIRR